MLCWFLGAGAIGGLEVWFPLYSALFVARKGVLFSVAVEGLALRACTLCSPFSGRESALPGRGAAPHIPNNQFPNPPIP